MRGKLADERAVVEARLVDLHQHQSTLVVDQATIAPHDYQGWPEPGQCGHTFGMCLASSTDGFGVLVAEEHPRHFRRTVGEELLTTSGPGIHFDP
jgi:hypothetical protein